MSQDLAVALLTVWGSAIIIWELIMLAVVLIITDERANGHVAVVMERFNSFTWLLAGSASLVTLFSLMRTVQ